MKNKVIAKATNPATGTEHEVQFESFATNHVGITVAAAERIKREHGFDPDINKIVTWVG